MNKLLRAVRDKDKKNMKEVMKEDKRASLRAQ